MKISGRRVAWIAAAAIGFGCTNDGAAPPTEVDAGETTDAGADSAVASTDAGGCTESNADFCARIGFACGSISSLDACGVARTANCGTCEGTMQCNPAHQCAPATHWERAGGGDLFTIYVGVCGSAGTTYVLMANGTVARVGPTVRDVRNAVALPPSARGMACLGPVFYAFGQNYVYRFEGGSGARVGSISGQINAVWASGPNDVWAGYNRGLQHWDGRGWNPTATSVITTEIFGLFGFSASDVWAVGAQARTFHWDGTAWTSVAVSSLVTGIDLTAVWGAAPNEVWSGGGAYDFGTHSVGNLLHLESNRWRDTTSGIGLIAALHGTSASDLWAVGAAGTILHYDGSRWQRQSVTASDQFNAVFAASSTDVWAVGDGGLIAHFGL